MWKRYTVTFPPESLIKLCIVLHTHNLLGWQYCNAFQHQSTPSLQCAQASPIHDCIDNELAVFGRVVSQTVYTGLPLRGMKFYSTKQYAMSLLICTVLCTVYGSVVFMEGWFHLRNCEIRSAIRFTPPTVLFLIFYLEQSWGSYPIKFWNQLFLVSKK